MCRRNKSFLEEKKNGKGKERKYLEKENFFSGEKKTEKEKEENIWRRKTFGQQGRSKKKKYLYGYTGCFF